MDTDRKDQIGVRHFPSLNKTINRFRCHSHFVYLAYFAVTLLSFSGSSESVLIRVHPWLEIPVAKFIFFRRAAGVSLSPLNAREFVMIAGGS